MQMRCTLGELLAVASLLHHFCLPNCQTVVIKSAAAAAVALQPDFDFGLNM